MFVICTYVFGYQLPLSNLLIYVPPIIGQCGFSILTLNFYPQSYIFLLCHIVCIVKYIYTCTCTCICMHGWNKSLSLSPTRLTTNQRSIPVTVLIIITLCTIILLLYYINNSICMCFMCNSLYQIPFLPQHVKTMILELNIFKNINWLDNL